MVKYSDDFIRRQLRVLFNDYTSCGGLYDIIGAKTHWWYIGSTYLELHSKDNNIMFDGDLLNITFADLQENYFEDILHPTQLELDFFKLQLGYDWPFTKEMKQDD